MEEEEEKKKTEEYQNLAEELKEGYGKKADEARERAESFLKSEEHDERYAKKLINEYYQLRDSWDEVYHVVDEAESLEEGAKNLYKYHGASADEEDFVRLVKDFNEELMHRKKEQKFSDIGRYLSFRKGVLGAGPEPEDFYMGKEIFSNAKKLREIKQKTSERKKEVKNFLKELNDTHQEAEDKVEELEEDLKKNEDLIELLEEKGVDKEIGLEEEKDLTDLFEKEIGEQKAENYEKILNEIEGEGFGETEEKLEKILNFHEKISGKLIPMKKSVDRSGLDTLPEEEKEDILRYGLVPLEDMKEHFDESFSEMEEEMK